MTDLGCGTGGYEKIISSVNIKIQGFDGNPETKTLDVSGGLCQGQTCKRCLTRFEIIDCYMTLVLLLSTQNIPIFHEYNLGDDEGVNARNWIWIF